MTFDRRDLLVRTGLLVGAGALAAAGCRSDDEARTAGAAKGLDTWEGVQASFELDRERAQLSTFLLASHPQPVREAIEGHRRGLDADPPLRSRTTRSGSRRRRSRAAAGYLGVAPEEIALTDSTTMGLGLLYATCAGARRRDRSRPSTTSTPRTRRCACARTRRRRRAPRAPLRRAGDRVRRRDRGGDPGRGHAADAGGRDHVGALEHGRQAAGARDRGRAGRARRRPAGARRSALRRRRARLRRRAGAAPRAGLRLPRLRLPQVALRAARHRLRLGPPEAWAETSPTIPSFTDRESFDAWLQGREATAATTAGAFTPGGYQAFEHRWALADAFAFRHEIGRERAAERTRALALRLKDGLGRIPGVVVQTPAAPELSSGFVCCEAHMPPTSSSTGCGRSTASSRA